MDAISVLGSLMGLAFVSGLRLYSTIFVIGLGIRFGYLVIPPHLTQLQLLAETPILIVAGVCYAFEFVADKIPWVDTVWDAIHTFIRPLGAAILAAAAVGTVDPLVRLATFLLCGGIALSSHSAKAGARIVANHSPEPFSNIGLSVAEDAIVVSGVWLALRHPLVSILVVTTAVVFTIWLIPRLIRLFRQQAINIRDFTRARFGRGSSTSVSIR
jgi:hypothetical protein